MKRLFENKAVIGCTCIVIAAVIAFIVLPKMYNEKGKTVYICRLQNDISAGTKIEDGMLKTEEVGSFGLPDTVIKNPEEIVGKYAKVNMTTDDYLLSTKFTDYVSDERLDRAVNEGKRLVSVSVPTNAAGVANHLKAGDKVTVAYYDDNAIFDDTLKGLEIYSVENENAQDLENVKNGENDELIAASITFIATEEQAVGLINAEYSGKLHIILESRGAV